MSVQSLIRKVCIQVAVYWGNPRSDGLGGMVYDDAVELKVRWDNVTKLIRDAKGKEVAAVAEVLVAGRLYADGTVEPVDLDVDGRLWLGTLEDLESGDLNDPLNIDGAWQIKRFDKMLSMAAGYYRRAYL